MTQFRSESDSLGEVQVPADRLWGAQTQRSLDHFSIGDDPMPPEMIRTYAILKKAAALVNHTQGNLELAKRDLITRVCDEISGGAHQEMFPLGVWISGSGTQFNMNVNEVIANRCSQLAGQPLGSKKPVHPNDDVNMSQSTNDTFPSAMYMAAAIGVAERLIPAVKDIRDGLQAKAAAWNDIVKIGRTHMMDATPLTLGQEFSGYVGMLDDNLTRLDQAFTGICTLVMGGTAVGTGINTTTDFDRDVTSRIAELTGLPFVSAPNKFALQGAHDGLIALSAAMKTLAVSLYKIANDIRLLASGPRAGFYELLLPANEPGSSIMPGKVNPTQCEALAMVSVQVMASDVAVTMGGAGGYLEMNVYKPLMIHNVMKSIRMLTDSMSSFRRYLIDGMEPNRKQIDAFVNRSLMLVTALSPVIGYDKASEAAHYALDHDLSLKDAVLKLGYASSNEFDRIVDPLKMVHPERDRS